MRSVQRWTVRMHASAVDSRQSGAGRSSPLPLRSRVTNPAFPAVRAFTLVEIAVVFAVIAILVVVVTYAARGGRTGAKVKQTRSVMNTLKLAMDEYKGVKGRYPPPPHYRARFVSGRAFDGVCPPIHYDMPADYYRNHVGTNQYPNVDAPVADAPNPPAIPADGIWGVDAPNNNLSALNQPYPSNGQKLYSIQGLYYFLTDEPSSRQALAKIESSFARVEKIQWPSGSVQWPANTTNYATVPVSPTTSRPPREVMAIVDAWGVPLYYGQKPSIDNNQPYVQSAGPDHLFDTDDDLFSFKGE